MSTTIGQMQKHSGGGERNDQKQDDKVWFYAFDENTLTLEGFIECNQVSQVERSQNIGGYEKQWKLLEFVQKFISSSNPAQLSEFKRQKIKDFKEQKSELEKNKLREGKSYYYETMITRLLENLDFFMRNELLLFQVNTFCKVRGSDLVVEQKAMGQLISRSAGDNRQAAYGQRTNNMSSDTFYRLCQDYIATEQLYCNDFWIFQSEKQRYFRYFCTCVRLFHFFFELCEFKERQDEFKRQKYIGSQEDLLEQEDLRNLLVYSFKEVKYCLQLISKNFQEGDSISSGLNILMLLLKHLIASGFNKTKQVLSQQFTANALALKKEFDFIKEQSKSKANDITNNQFKEIHKVTITDLGSKEAGRFPVIKLLNENIQENVEQLNYQIGKDFNGEVEVASEYEYDKFPKIEVQEYHSNQ